MEYIKHFGTVKDGKIILKNKIKFNDQLKEFENKDIVIKVSVYSNKRTNDQNSLFWKWVEIISNETGYTKQETKELITYKFLRREEIDEEGYTNTFIKGTSTLSKSEFKKFMDELCYWSNTTLNINLPTYE